MSTVLLSEIAEINPPLGISLADTDEVSFVPMGAFSEVTASVVAEETRHFGQVKKGFTGFRSGDVIFAKITPCFENGKIGLANISRHVGFGSTEFHVIRAKPGVADARYLHHFLRQGSVRLSGTKRMTGSAGQRRVPKTFLESLQVPDIPMEEQRRIAAILDQAEELRAKRRAAIALLDQLPQAIFLEMFGDPAANPKGLATALLGDLCIRITDGTHQPPKFADSGHPFLFVRNIVTGEINFDTEKFISDETHEELTRRCPIEQGDVIYSTVGSYGVPVVVRTSKKFAFQRHIAHLKPNREKLLPEFLSGMLASPPVRRQADGFARGVAQKTINLADIRRYVVFAPPIEMQQHFVVRVEAIHRAKAAHQSALAELDALIASLQASVFSDQHPRARKQLASAATNR